MAHESNWPSWINPVASPIFSGETPCCSGNPLEPFAPSRIGKPFGGQEKKLGYGNSQRDWAIRMVSGYPFVFRIQKHVTPPQTERVLVEGITGVYNVHLPST
jgi:hypothetical protein